MAGSLLKPADEIGDGHVELLRQYHRRVQQKSTDIPFYRFGLSGGHSEEHLEFNAGANASFSGKQPGESYIEEVVPGNADMNSVDAIRAQCVVQNSLVVRIGCLLGRPGGQWPAPNG